MPKNTVTLSLDGDVPLADFASSMERLTRLMKALSKEIGGKSKIEWTIDDLQAGSATATIAGVSESSDAVERVVIAYAHIGEALAHGQPIPYGGRIRREAIAITDVIDSNIKTIRFITNGIEHRVARRYEEGQKSPQLVYARGAVTGTIETLSRRGGYKFTLYDAIFDEAVTCYLAPTQEDVMRDAWGKRARVFGRIGRDPETGHPVTVRSILRVDVLPDTPKGSFEQAKGLWVGAHGQRRSEDLIRSNRDG